MAEEWQKNWFAGAPKEHLEAIGQIVVCFGQLEAWMRTVIWHYANLDPSTGRIFTGKARFTDLVDTLKLLAENGAADRRLKTEISDLCDGLRKLNERRNEVIHGVWGMGNNGPNVSKFLLLKKEDKEGSIDMPLATLRQLAEDIMVFQRRLLSHTIPPDVRNQMPPGLADAVWPTPWLDKSE